MKNIFIVAGFAVVLILSGCQKNFLEKTRAITRYGMRNALYFHNVDAGAYEHERNLPCLHVSTRHPHGYEIIPKSCRVTVKIRAFQSDHGRCD